MKIVIAEKPSVAKSIARFFGATQSGNGCISGNGVAVTWCFGHLFEQAEPDYYGERYKKWDMDVLPIVPETWKLLPKADAKKTDQDNRRFACYGNQHCPRRRSGS